MITIQGCVNSDVTEQVINDFGEEWTRFDQSTLSDIELEKYFRQYFKIFPWGEISEASLGADFGCGSGRWAKFIAPRVRSLHLIDASPKAIDVARRNLTHLKNISFHTTSIEENPIPKCTLDFAYCLGVLHHISDTERALKKISETLRPGAPFLVYIYYAFDNRPAWYFHLWRISNLFRKGICGLPRPIKFLVAECLAAFIYFPLSRLARWFEFVAPLPSHWPLAYYRNSSYYTLRTDALDRFGTRLEKRFSRNDIYQMMTEAGFEDLVFSSEAPFWCVVGKKGKAKAK